MFDPSNTKKSDIAFDQLPESIQTELWHMIFMRQHKGLALTSPQRFNFFKDPVMKTLSVVHSQAEPYFSDSVSAPYIPEFEAIQFPARVFVYDQGDHLLMTTEQKS